MVQYFQPMLHFFAASLILSVSFCSRSGEFVFQGKTMGTDYTVRIYSDEIKLNHLEEKKLHDSIQSELDRIDALMSNWKHESEISRFNRWPAGRPFPISEDFMTVFSQSDKIFKKTSGAFDPTLNPLIDLWGFGSKTAPGEIPSHAEINKTLKRTGFQKIRIENSSLVKLHDGIELNVSAIAKGYAVDRTFMVIKNMGFRSIMVEVGGEIRTGMPPPGKKHWNIGIEKPDYSGKRSIQEIIQMQNLSIATSGDYRNFFRSDDRTYSHILDPKTGMPVQNGMVSASIIGPECMTADALATSMLVLGSKKGLEVLKLFPDYEGLLIDKNSSDELKEYMTPGMQNYMASHANSGSAK